MVLSAGNIRGYLHPLPRRNRVPELRRKAARNPDPFRREQAYLRLASFLPLFLSADHVHQRLRCLYTNHCRVCVINVG